MSESRAPARMRHSWEARCRMVRLMLDGVAPVDAARFCGASRATAYRLLARFSAGGWDALRDRPPIAKHCPWRLSVAAEQQILELRARTGWGPARLAALLGRPPSTVWRVLKRGGVSRRATQPRPDARRYEYAQPGGLIHLDIKRLGRFWQPGKRVLGSDVGNLSRRAGWQYLHVMIDDHSRLAHAVVLPTESPADCRRALHEHLAWLTERGIHAERVLTDNGNGYRSFAFADATQSAGLKHLRTRPRRPQTNGKAEALIGILQREWAYAHVWQSSADRARALPGYLRWYNTHRPHGSLGAPPISRISQAAGSYI
jgi:transposase InsO family protein